jgi:hypothetical protein
VAAPALPGARSGRTGIPGRHAQRCGERHWFAAKLGPRTRPPVQQNCGNLLAGVGPFAVERGLMAAEPGETTIRIRMATDTREDILRAGRKARPGA